MAIIELGNGTYLSRVWFLGGNPEADVIVAVLRPVPGGPWELRYRFRYYRDDVAFDSADEKSSYVATIDWAMPETEVVAKARELVRKMAALAPKGGFPEVDEVVVESDDPRVFYAQIKDKPWVHVKVKERSR